MPSVWRSNLYLFASFQLETREQFTNLITRNRTVVIRSPKEQTAPAIPHRVYRSHSSIQILVR